MVNCESLVVLNIFASPEVRGRTLENINVPWVCQGNVNGTSFSLARVHISFSRQRANAPTLLLAPHPVLTRQEGILATHAMALSPGKRQNKFIVTLHFWTAEYGIKVGSKSLAE